MNLVLICSDTFRWDYLGCYGNEWIETPNLDAMAKESAVYEQAFGEGLPTLPARRVMVTGRRIIPMEYHAQHTDKVSVPGWHPLYFEDVTLAEHLLAKDYATCMVTDVYHMMKPGKNFHRGMEYWYWIRGVEDDKYNWRDLERVQDVWPTVSSWGQGAIEDPRHWLVQHINGRVQWQDESDSMTGRVMTKAMDWVEGFHGDYPFFMWIDMFDPHEPWDPPVEYGKKYDPNFDPYKSAFPPGSTERMTEDEFRCVKAGYAGECTMVDAWVGRFMDKLEETGKLDDTIVIFTSDHGGMMGEQGEVHKGAGRLRNQVTQVPLIIRHPKGEAAGARVRGFVQHQDIMPTALSMMGEDVPERCNGTNVWPLAVEGRDSEVEQIITCFGWHASVRNQQCNYIAPWAEVPDKRGAERVELYDLENDPEELTNVIDEHPEIAAEMHAWMEDYLEEHKADSSGDLGPGQQGPEHDQAYI